MTDQPEPTRPAPILTEDNHAYWDAAREGRLVAQRCGGCERLRHPPRPMCPHCHSLEWEIVDLSGEGVVYSYAIIHYPQNPAFEYPIIASLIELNEGVRVLSNVIGLQPEEVAVGLPVQVEFVSTRHDGHVPVFRPRRNDG